MVKIGDVIEIILYVKDMDSQVGFYRDVLGLEIITPKGLETYTDQMWVTFDTGPCILALHGGGEGNFGKDAPKFVFEVNDVELTRSQLIERGVAMGEIRSPSPGVMVSDGEDPEGNWFSIESQ
jgi:predicted enzyme related to lactoylglutathione lyase